MVFVSINDLELVLLGFFQMRKVKEIEVVLIILVDLGIEEVK